MTSFNPRKLLDARAYPHPVSQLRLVETHISWVILTGAYAYKIKKPVNLGFLDFSTLALRQQACLDELRLNRRLAPELYLEVGPITGTPDHPVISGDGPPIDYAVKMLEFAQDAQLDRLLEAGRLQPQDMDTLAQTIASFHAAAPRATAGMPHGEPASLRRPVHDNLEMLLRRSDGSVHDAVAGLATWTSAREAELESVMRQRRSEGYTREVHGDLHLANLVKLDSRILPFDCIEFSETLRWLDVISDIAFTSMDLHFRGRGDLAYRLLNRYLEISGDYGGLRLLRYYEVYRALVRAKVALIRCDETAGSERHAESQRLATYVELARQRSHSDGARLILMHGLAGSGKTWLSDQLMSTLPAIRLRSDVERKRLHGLAAQQASGSTVMDGLYSREKSGQTYAHLAAMAAAIIAGGESVIVDAAFLRRADRADFQQLAQRLNLPCVLLSCEAPVAELRRRVTERARLGADASEADQAVLEHQLTSTEPLDAAERQAAVIVPTAQPVDPHRVLAELRRKTDIRLS